MKLNVVKIRRELRKLERPETWLANQSGVSRQRMSYWMKTQSLAGAEYIAKVFDIDPKDLLI